MMSRVETGGERGVYLTFGNIRYADPPVGENRFKAPVPVSTVDRNVNDGSHGSKCPQAFPSWSLEEAAEEAGVTPDIVLRELITDPTISEDCLFLDVVVPCDIFNKHAEAEQALGRYSSARIK